MSKTFKDGKNKIKVRRFWGQMNPMTQIRESGKKFDRNRRNDWKKDLSFA